MDKQKQTREHLLELLEGKSAHIELEKTLTEFPVRFSNQKVENSPHTAWELLEHLRIAQSDILEFSRNANHESPEFPGGYWNKKRADEKDWESSVEQILDDLKAMRDLIMDEKTDLFAEIPGGTGQTIFREALLIADHNAYHLGQIVLLQRILEKGEK